MTPLQSDTQYQDQSFEALKLNRARIESSAFLDCRFHRCSMVEAVLRSCRFHRCTFTGCDLSLAEVAGSVFVSVQFEECKLAGINWTKASYNQPSIGKPLSFKKSILNHSTFISLPMQGTKIIECMAHEVDFREADLSDSSFTGTDLHGSLFGNTTLHSADLRSARNYRIDPTENSLKDARFTLPEAMSLLYTLDIQLDDGDCDV
jgi:fluoroquinolone resistance protein